MKVTHGTAIALATFVAGVLVGALVLRYVQGRAYSAIVTTEAPGA